MALITASGVKTVTILNTESLSDAIELEGCSLVAVLMPAAWTAATLTFQASHDNATYRNVYDEYGTEVAFQVAVSRLISIKDNLGAFCGLNYLKVRSGTSGAAVAQLADRSIILLIRPFK